MNKIKEALTRELTGWKKWQVFWIIFANAMILGISIYQKDSWLGIVASITGVFCVILCGMGKVSNYFFGTINVILYAIVAWKAKYYGDVMLNLLYYFPTNIIGWIAWKKHIDEETNAVYKRRLTWKQDIVLAVVSIVGVLGYAYVLKLLGGNLPIVDSMSTVFSVIAQILMIKRFTEQWVIWIIVNIVSVIMWVAALFTEAASIAVLLMWSVYLANAIIMFVKWMKDSKNQEMPKVEA
ncbi:MAG: nicotinamide riboside transporter PnuC [Eubacterium sp.]|jgi:nicotinamide mononucleotide transporter PnuC|nr:nicotinamide riboside transporter PnuC [Eubacterium sp.]